MTTADTQVVAWANHPLGKAARVAIAVAGLVTATLVLTAAGFVAEGSWALVLLGVSLAATAIRAARVPTTSRLALTAGALIAILLAYQAL